MYTFIIVCCGIVLLYLYGTRNFRYWTRKGVKQEKPVPFFGNEMTILLGRIGWPEHYFEMYCRHPNEKIVGFYRGNKPCLLIRDPELARNIFTTDFYSFHQRGLIPDINDPEPLFQNLFCAEGDKWRLLRQRLSPMFTSGKLKAMFPLIVERANKLQELSEGAASNGTVVDVRDLFARYTTDFIGACAFGIDMNSLDDINSNFRTLGKRIFKFTVRDMATGAIKIMFPTLGTNLSFIAPEVRDGILHIMKTVMAQRNDKPSNRNDFIDILLELKEKGTIIGESIEFQNPDGTPKKVTLDVDDWLLAAQVYVFFAAGFETASSSSSFALHLLAYHPECQKKVHDEIDKVLAKYNNTLCYHAVQEMKYLEMVFKEALRIMPPLGFLNRRSVTKYTFPGTSVTIDPGMEIFIPIYGYHNDPKYFDDPEEFRPERFHPKNAHIIKKCPYLPFGEGYRNCIGELFQVHTVKVFSR